MIGLDPIKQMPIPNPTCFFTATYPPVKFRLRSNDRFYLVLYYLIALRSNGTVKIINKYILYLFLSINNQRGRNPKRHQNRLCFSPRVAEVRDPPYPSLSVLIWDSSMRDASLLEERRWFFSLGFFMGLDLSVKR